VEAGVIGEFTPGGVPLAVNMVTVKTLLVYIWFYCKPEIVCYAKIVPKLNYQSPDRKGGGKT
jgi:hypothetical protein